MKGNQMSKLQQEFERAAVEKFLETVEHGLLKEHHPDDIFGEEVTAALHEARLQIIQDWTSSDKSLQGVTTDQNILQLNRQERKTLKASWAGKYMIQNDTAIWTDIFANYKMHELAETLGMK